MRSCLTIFFAGLVLAAIGLGLAYLASGQLRAGFCLDQPLKVALGLLGGGFAILVVTLGILYLTNRELLESSLSFAQIAIFSLIVMVVSLALMANSTYRASQLACTRQDIFTLAAPACQGQGVPGAAPFRVASPDAWHLVVLGRGGQKTQWTNLASNQWKPQNVNDLELVVCMSEPQSYLVETCPSLLGRKAKRYSQQVTVQLVEALTGQVLATDILSTTPEACPASGLDLTGRLETPFDLQMLGVWIDEALVQLADHKPGIVAVNQVIPTAAPPTPTYTLQPTSTPSPMPTAVPTAAALKNARVRSGPGKDQPIIAGLMKGETAQVLGSSTDRLWVLLITPRGETGWVFAELLAMEFPIDQLPVIPP
jgi:hypothetical protein